MGKPAAPRFQCLISCALAAGTRRAGGLFAILTSTYLDLGLGGSLLPRHLSSYGIAPCRCSQSWIVGAAVSRQRDGPKVVCAVNHFACTLSRCDSPGHEGVQNMGTHVLLATLLLGVGGCMTVKFKGAGDPSVRCLPPVPGCSRRPSSLRERAGALSLQVQIIHSAVTRSRAATSSTVEVGVWLVGSRV